MYQGTHVIRLAAVAVTLTALTVACGKGNQNANGAGAGQTTASTSMTDSSSGSGGRSAAANGSASATSFGEVAPSSDISQMSDSNIVAKLDAGDKAQVALAKVMETKASNDSVKAYARKLVTDHTKSERDVMQLEIAQRLSQQLSNGGSGGGAKRP